MEINVLLSNEDQQSFGVWKMFWLESARTGSSNRYILIASAHRVVTSRQDLTFPWQEIRQQPK